MNRSFFIRCLFAIGILFTTLYFYLDRQNRLTQVQMKLPRLAKEVKMLKEENIRLQYQVEQFENPAHLLTLAKKGEFSHLKHPLNYQVLMISERGALQLNPENEEPPFVHIRPRITFAKVR